MPELLGSLLLGALILLVAGASAALWLGWLASKERTFARFRSPRWFFPYAGLGVAAAFAALLAQLALGDFDDGVWYRLTLASIEETAKFGAFLLVAERLARPREAFDATAASAAVAIGFAAAENALYGFREGLAIALTRSFLTIQGHLLFASIPALCYGLSRLDRRLRGERLRAGLPIAGLAAASLLHGSCNLALEALGARGTVGLATFLWPVELGAYAAIVERASKASPYRPYPFSQWRLAIAALGRGLDADPGNPDLLFRRGLYCLAGGLWAEACVAFDGAGVQGRRPALAASFYAAALYASGEEAEARRLLGESWPGLRPRERAFFRSRLGQALASRRGLREEILELAGF